MWGCQNNRYLKIKGNLSISKLMDLMSYGHIEYVGDIVDELEFKFDRLTSITRWATDSRGRKLRVLDIFH